MKGGQTSIAPSHPQPNIDSDSQEVVMVNHKLKEHLREQAIEIATLRQEILGRHLTGKREKRN